jgi:RNA polymerase sigma-70 factor, ECF subfamily
MTGMVVSDEQLMLELANGSRAAFELLVQRWDRRMLNYFIRCTPNRDEAEDLRQELFLRVYLRAHTFKVDGAFQAWLYRIATNLVIDKVARKKSMKPETHTELETAMAEPQLSTHTQARQNVNAKELTGLIHQALEKIPSEQKVALVMRHFEGLRFEEIAAILDVSESTLKSRVYRGLTALKVELQRMGIFEIDCFQEV